MLDVGHDHGLLCASWHADLDRFVVIADGALRRENAQHVTGARRPVPTIMA